MSCWSRVLSAQQLVEATLDGIDAAAELGAFTRVLRDEARAEATERDRERAAGGAVGPLHGIPIAIKDEFDVAGVVTTFGTRANSTLPWRMPRWCAGCARRGR